MDLANAPFFSLLRARLDQLGERQRLIAENVANASTPKYTPRDIDTAAFERMMQDVSRGTRTAMRQTNPRHMSANGAPTPRIVERADSETTMDGNAVVLEEQMMRAAETRMNFETGVALYQKGLQLVRIAAKPPGS